LASFAFLRRLAALHSVEGQGIPAAKCVGPYVWGDACGGNPQTVMGGDGPARCCCIKGSLSRLQAEAGRLLAISKPKALRQC
jgi:hypothetical protein